MVCVSARCRGAVVLVLIGTLVTLVSQAFIVPSQPTRLRTLGLPRHTTCVRMVRSREGWGYTVECDDPNPEYLPNPNVKGTSPPGLVPENAPAFELDLDFEFVGIGQIGYHDALELMSEEVQSVKQYLNETGHLMSDEDAEEIERERLNVRKERLAAREQQRELDRDEDEELIDDVLDDIPLPSKKSRKEGSSLPKQLLPVLPFDEDKSVITSLKDGQDFSYDDSDGYDYYDATPSPFDESDFDSRGVLF